MSTKVHERKDHPHFKEKGGWASKSLSSLNPDNTWQSCDLNSEVSDSKALTFFSMPNCLSFMEEPVLGMGDTDTHTHTHTHTRFSFAAAAKSLQSCPTLSDPMDCSLPGSSVHGIFQARVLEWGAIAFSFHLLVMFNSLRPHRLQHTRPPCLLLSPGVCPRSCPLTQWCHSTISSFAALFSFWLQSFPVSGSFPMCVCVVC